MKNKILVVILLIIIVIPQVVFAAWWNPFSWFNNWTFKKNEPAPVIQVETKQTPEEHVADSQEQINKLENKQSAVPAEIKSVKTETVSQTPAKSQGSCSSDSFFSEITNTCVSQLDYCKSVLGPDATYNAINNSCHSVESANTVCSNTNPNTTWGGEFGSDGKYICVCETGFTLNSSTNSCFKSTSSNVSSKSLNDILSDLNSKTDNSWRECSNRQDEIEAEIRAEIEANGGFGTASQIAAMALNRMKDEGMSQCFSSSGSLINSGGGTYSSTKCNSLSGGWDCYSSSGGRTQIIPIGNGQYDIRSW
ncbi:MAG: hypothetical protein AAB446_00610 [Patescibacteria group bacterium]